MKFINETGFNTKELRKMILTTIKQEGIESRWLTIIAKNATTRYVGGSYNQGGMRIKLKIPKGDLELLEPYILDTLKHEIAHYRGVKHSEMKTSQRYAVTISPPYNPT